MGEPRRPSLVLTLYFLGFLDNRPGSSSSSTGIGQTKEGKRRLITLGPEEMEKLGTLAERYRRLRRGRALLIKTFAGMLKDFDRLEKSLRVPASRALRNRSRDGGP